MNLIYFLCILVSVILLPISYGYVKRIGSTFRYNSKILVKTESKTLQNYQASKQNKNKSIVLVVGFEAFNFQLYKKTVGIVKEKVPSVNIEILTDIDISEKSERVESLLQNADVLLCSLLFDYEQLQWILPKIQNIPTKFCFESAQELMSETSVGTFTMRPAVDDEGKVQAAGPPPFVRNLLKQFGSNKEEDKMQGYLNLLKIGPKVLNLIPTNAIQGPFGDKLKDIKTWLTVYAYWNQGTVQNIVSMLYFIIDTFNLVDTTSPSLFSSSSSSLDTTDSALISNSNLQSTNTFSSNSGISASSQQKVAVAVPKAAELVEIPNVAFYHPDLYESQGYVEKAITYTSWYEKTHKWVNDDTPRVGLLLYRKHVLSEQAYIGNLIGLLEDQGLMPIPVFITGVEAHVIVRDIFVTKNDISSSMYLGQSNCYVDCIVNTIGFPLVGGE